ncbi:NADPH-dependent assimilatory sulfite reductase hemoprotein subunit [Roseomonas sp. NAR14]|uniref:NADPH-dependent assimilatory sulfite reductase hemoprotein subunit n=1 Tax=Roseomonas acroporae TaxID=2937791 RepID=A0A9X2BXR2_9PROT|nr:NADPH-dependent assimilatory sulfite reductase hemoprotein subunit [Roseomonas acroporae]MCK8786209.1 NADPH-dependent assimilatory sulfite reductase hemoprotein subunit [Roseomonas acroporae]
MAQATKPSVATPPAAKPSGVETLKEGSRLLRGGIAGELAADSRGGISEDSYNLLKFHGSYEQFDRDTATERKQRGEDKDWQFMARVRLPGGRLTAAQYLVLDALADRYADRTLRITSRQAIQFHGILRGNLKPAVAAINHSLLTTFAACGDVVRNVVTSPAPRRDALHAALEADARMLSSALLPRTRSYHEIFLDEEPVVEPEEEPLYGRTYLPRKFKIALAHPADNTADVLANDLGLVAVTGEDPAGEPVGYNVHVGGGMGMTHNKPATFPRLATALAYVARADLLRLAEAVIRFQRDNGDRTDRKRARLKYVVHDRGIDWVREQVETYYGEPLQPPRPVPPLRMPELLGWHEQGDGNWWLGVPVPAGRIVDHGPDQGEVRLRTAFRTIVERFGLDLNLTPQQDALLTGIAPGQRAAVEAVLREHGVRLAEEITPIARWSLACVALPTCGQSLTEGERARAPMVADVEAALARHGLEGERISFRVTGCPNGCARPYQGDIGLVGRMPGHYVLYVGGDFAGTRMSFPLLDRVAQERVGETLEPLFAAWAGDRREGEGFGDFCHRLGRDALLALLPAALLPATKKAA